MKTYVITLSKTFPKGHIRAGEPTNFAHLLGNGLNLTDEGLQLCKHKIHTIRANYDLWAKRFADVERGEACISVREWADKPYRSKQVEIARLTKEDGVGIQSLHHHPDVEYAVDNNGWQANLFTIAKNDGLSFDDWRSWLKYTDLSQPLAIIHFTKFRY